MNEEQHGSRRHSRLAIIFALVLIFLGSVALSVVIQSGIPRLASAVVRGQFYTPVPNSSASIGERFLGGFALLRLAMWPILAFLVLLAGATYAISTLLSFEGRVAAIRRWAVGAGLSFVSSTVLAVVWSIVAGKSSQ